MKKKHWWLKDEKFKRVSYNTLLRLSLLFEAEVIAGREVDTAARFMLWLEDYME